MNPDKKCTERTRLSEADGFLTLSTQQAIMFTQGSTYHRCCRWCGEDMRWVSQSKYVCTGSCDLPFPQDGTVRNAEERRG